MTDNLVDKKKWKQCQLELNSILNDWDFIGVLPAKLGPTDEYKCIIEPILTLLRDGGDVKSLKKYLESEIKGHFELGEYISANPSEVTKVSNQIIHWWAQSRNNLR